MKKNLRIDINKAMSICFRNGLKVEPVVTGKSFVIHVNDNGNVIEYNKKISSNQVATAVTKTYKHFALKILKQQEYA